MSPDVGIDAPPPDRDPATISPRARRTRARLVDASRTVFERDGFTNARIVDIAEEAGAAIGSFYTHFRSKREIFLALMEDVQEEMLHPARLEGAKTVEDAVANANRTYLNSYQRNAALMAALEEFAMVDADFREVRLKRGSAFTTRNARMIERLQVRGLVDPDLDPWIAAQSLSGMVSRAAYQAYVLHADRDPEALLTTLTRLWLNALGIIPSQRQEIL